MGSQLPRQVLILSSIEWDAAWQRHQAFARQWAEAGHRVFFVENTGFRAPGLRDAGRVARRLASLARKDPATRNPVPPGVVVVNPLVLPPSQKRLNARLFVPRLARELAGLGLEPGSLVVAYLPTATTLAIMDRVRPAVSVYDCVDNFFGHPEAPSDLAETEGALVRRCALVVTTSSTLRAEKEKLHARVLELHHGVSPAFFLPSSPRREYRRLCYFGSLWKAVDYAALRALAQAGFEVRLVGPVREPLPPLPATVSVEPAVPHERLPRLLEACDALLLPYVDDEYNRGVIPAKIYECLATGRPVLASRLPALADLSRALYFCRSPSQWVAAARALPDAETPERREARVALAREHAEDKTFARLRAAIAAARDAR